MTPEQLTLEQAQSKLAAYAALGACAGLLVAIGLYVMAVKDADARSRASLLKVSHEHATQLIMSGLFRTVAFALIAVVLGFLIGAAFRRLEGMPRAITVAAYAGPALFAVVTPISTLAQLTAARDFVRGGDLSVKAADAALSGGFVMTTTYVMVFAVFLMAVAWLAVGIYCMRAGLLTRFVGGVAVGIGVLTVLSVYGPSLLMFLVQFFWLAALAVMLLATEETKPPAWRLGAAVSWREVDAAKRTIEVEAPAAPQAAADPAPGTDPDSAPASSDTAER